MKIPIQFLASEINFWADQTFPDRTDQSMYLKLYGEIAELIEADDPVDEFADLMILLLDFAVRKNINIVGAIDAKMKVNRERTWEKTNLGVYKHVE